MEEGEQHDDIGPVSARIKTSRGADDLSNDLRAYASTPSKLPSVLAKREDWSHELSVTWVVGQRRKQLRADPLQALSLLSPSCSYSPTTVDEYVFHCLLLCVAGRSAI